MKNVITVITTAHHYL